MREAAQRDQGLRFTTLLHHVNGKLLLDSFCLLKRQAAPGVNRATWGEYEEGEEARITDLHDRIHQGAYRGAAVTASLHPETGWAATPRLRASLLPLFIR